MERQLSSYSTAIRSLNGIEVQRLIYIAVPVRAKLVQDSHRIFSAYLIVVTCLKSPLAVIQEIVIEIVEQRVSAHKSQRSPRRQFGIQLHIKSIRKVLASRRQYRLTRVKAGSNPHPGANARQTGTRRAGEPER